MMDLDETALLSEQHLEQSLIRLREEERQLIEQQSVMEAGAYDDIAALEHQDALRLNHVIFYSHNRSPNVIVKCFDL